MKAEDWIKVTDSLPEAKYGPASSDVLIHIVNEDGDYVIRVGIYDYHHDSWLTIRGWIDESYETVTHWMPLVLPEISLKKITDSHD